MVTKKISFGKDMVSTNILSKISKAYNWLPYINNVFIDGYHKCVSQKPKTNKWLP